MHLTDEIGQQRVADVAGGGSAAAVLVVAGLGDPEDAGGHVHDSPSLAITAIAVNRLLGHHLPEQLAGGGGSPARSPARRSVASPP